jgi:RNA polymerase sigma-70 factor (ECF subfamily)
MTQPFDPSESELPGVLRGSWHRFLEIYEPLRAELYRYCRHLTRSAWDAEDLCQDTLSRAYVTLSQMGEAPPKPKAWLFRVASNLWIDQVRRRRSEAPLRVALQAAAAGAVPSEPIASREAAGTLLSQLAPQERVAIVLKDVFDFSLEEVAESLVTTPNAVKAALHRGRGKLADSEPEQAPARAATPPVLDAFCKAFNAGDLDRLTALLLDTSVAEVVGATTTYGPEAARRTVLYGMLFGVTRLATADVNGGIEARFMRGVLPDAPRVELRDYRGELVLLHWYAHEDGEAVRAITRVEAEGDRLSRIRNYFFNADLVTEVCAELAVPCRVNGYRWWLTGRC